MEIAFQNKREDFEAFYDYMVKETQEGKMLSKQAFNIGQIRMVLIAVLIGALLRVDGDGGVTWFLALFIFLGAELIFFLFAGFKPYYYSGLQIYKRQEKSLTPKDLQVFSLSRTLTADDNWLEIHSSEAIHRWRWRRVDRIGLTSSFIFIHVGNCPVVYIPKRDFPSEQSFLDFGKKLVELQEKNKNQSIGSE